MQKKKYPAAVAKPQANYKEALLRAATGSPAAAVPAPKKALPKQSQPGAGRKVADTCSWPALVGLQTEVRVMLSCDLMYSRQAVSAPISQ